MAFCCEKCEKRHNIAIPQPRNFIAKKCGVCKKYAVCLEVPEANIRNVKK